MWSTPREASPISGFSLTEALVALAIAAFLGAVLTRFVSNTRANALQIRQEVATDILSDSLLESLGSRELRPGRIDGRSGALRWHIDVRPMTFSAQALSLSEKKPANSAQQTNGLGVAPSNAPAGGGVPASLSSGGTAGSAPGWAVGLALTMSSNQTTSTATSLNRSASAPTAPKFTWTPYRVTVVITSPTGRSHAVDTIRLVQRSEERSDQAAKR